MSGQQSERKNEHGILNTARTESLLKCSDFQAVYKLEQYDRKCEKRNPLS